MDVDISHCRGHHPETPRRCREDGNWHRWPWPEARLVGRWREMWFLPPKLGSRSSSCCHDLEGTLSLLPFPIDTWGEASMPDPALIHVLAPPAPWPRRRWLGPSLKSSDTIIGKAPDNRVSCPRLTLTLGGHSGPVCKACSLARF